MTQHHLPVVSCRHCLAWGVPNRSSRCQPCREFEARHRQSVGPCQACRRRLPLWKGFCRLCWCQAWIDRGPVSRDSELLPFAQAVRHQQLFLAYIPKPISNVVRPPRKRGVGTGSRGVTRKLPPPVAGRPGPRPVQLRLMDDLRRTYRPGEYDLRREPVPDNPWLAWALHLAHTMAETRGWSRVVLGALNRNLVMLLAGHLDGALIRYSDYHTVVRGSIASVGRVTEVLQAMGVLLDDRPDTFDSWLTGKLAPLPSPIRSDVLRWARQVRTGTPRLRQRSEHTVRVYIYVLLPILADWSQRHQHLREVTRDDVLTLLGTLHGLQREQALCVLRVLFRWAKREGLVFRNPTIGLKSRRPERPILQPLDDDEIGRTIRVATTPHARLFVVLAAVHAARHGEIRKMSLDDVELGNRRLTIAGRIRPLDDLTYQVVLDWLDYRSHRWPNTANPHLLISDISASHSGPVSHPWVGRLLRGLPATIERLRIDRQLDEALASGADPLHLTEVFQISPTTAINYAISAKHLLQRPHEATPLDSPRTGPSPPTIDRDRPLGSG